MRIRNFIKSFYKPSERLFYPVGLYNLGVGLFGVIGEPDMPLQHFYQDASYFNVVTGAMLLVIATGSDILGRNRNPHKNGY